MKPKNKNSAPNFLIFFFENFSLQDDAGTWNYLQSKNVYAGLFT